MKFCSFHLFEVALTLGDLLLVAGACVDNTYKSASGTELLHDILEKQRDSFNSSR